jgi:hypothetical protein
LSKVLHTLEKGYIDEWREVRQSSDARCLKRLASQFDWSPRNTGDLGFQVAHGVNGTDVRGWRSPQLLREVGDLRNHVWLNSMPFIYRWPSSEPVKCFVLGKKLDRSHLSHSRLLHIIFRSMETFIDIYFIDIYIDVVFSVQTTQYIQVPIKLRHSPLNDSRENFPEKG